MTIFFSVVAGLMIGLVPQLLWLVCALVGRLMGHGMAYAPFGWVSVGLVALAWIVMVYGFLVGRFQIETPQEELCSKRVPKNFDGYRIVHISDLHLSTFDDRPEALQRIVDSINAQQPDLICFTGDLVTLGAEEAAPHTAALQGLKARDGVVSVLGNHDFLIYNRQLLTSQAREQAVEGLVAYERDSLGWKVLRNEHLTIERGTDKLQVMGVDNKKGDSQGFATIDRGDLNKAQEGTLQELFSLLLTHDPSHWSAEVWGKTIDLTLSGHTHAAQIRLGRWTPASWMFEQVDGRYDHGGQTLLVSAGIGCTLPMRIGCPSQITTITLRARQ